MTLLPSIFDHYYYSFKCLIYSSVQVGVCNKLLVYLHCYRQGGSINAQKLMSPLPIVVHSTIHLDSELVATVLQFVV